MAGGAGTRFWPASRVDRPKQLIDFGLGQSLLEEAVSRLAGLIPPSRVHVLTNSRLVDATRRALPHLPASQTLGEPCKRDTAPCVGLAAALVMYHDPDAIMLVTPADHVISTSEAFQKAVMRAVKLVEDDPGRIATFGIKPRYPATTFGYIERGEQPLDSLSPPAFVASKFHEKPKLDKAEEYVASGKFYWNAGIFIWRAKTVWEALKLHEPKMHERLQAIAQTIGTPRFDEAFAREFEAIEGKSIDFAVMERYPNRVVVEASFDWDDLGNWPSLSRIKSSDPQGNTSIGKHIGVRTKHCVVSTDSRHLVATLGVENLIIVHTPDATLVANRNDEEAVREIVKKLEELGWKEHL
jgi:mannose-1-phosphate guanylyltransferase